MSADINPQKIINNLDNLLKKANPQQLRLIYMVAYAIIKR